MWEKACHALKTVITTCIKIYVDFGEDPADLWTFVIGFAETELEKLELSEEE